MIRYGLITLGLVFGLIATASLPGAAQELAGHRPGDDYRRNVNDIVVPLTISELRVEVARLAKDLEARAEALRLEAEAKFTLQRDYREDSRDIIARVSALENFRESISGGAAWADSIIKAIWALGGFIIGLVTLWLGQRRRADGLKTK